MLASRSCQSRICRGMDELILSHIGGFVSNRDDTVSNGRIVVMANTVTTSSMKKSLIAVYCFLELAVGCTDLFQGRWTTQFAYIRVLYCTEEHELARNRSSRNSTVSPPLRLWQASQETVTTQKTYVVSPCAPLGLCSLTDCNFGA